MVYRPILQGTIEDKIAELIEHKTEMAEKIVGEGEKLITELDDRQLFNLFRLERSNGEEADGASVSGRLQDS